MLYLFLIPLKYIILFFVCYIFNILRLLFPSKRRQVAAGSIDQYRSVFVTQTQLKNDNTIDNRATNNYSSS